MWTMWVTTYCEAWKIDENRTKWPYISKWLIWIAQWCSLLQLEDPPRWSNWQCHCYGQWGKCSRALDLDVKPWLKTGPSPMCSCKMKTFFGPWPSYHTKASQLTYELKLQYVMLIQSFSSYVDSTWSTPNPHQQTSAMVCQPFAWNKRA